MILDIGGEGEIERTQPIVWLMYQSLWASSISVKISGKCLDDAGRNGLVMCDLMVYARQLLMRGGMVSVVGDLMVYARQWLNAALPAEEHLIASYFILLFIKRGILWSIFSENNLFLCLFLHQGLSHIHALCKNTDWEVSGRICLSFMMLCCWRCVDYNGAMAVP